MSNLPLMIANVGTPLMWAGLLHLTFGNLLIGAIEGLIIGRLFRVLATRAIFWMIIGNYFSAVGGALGFSWIDDRLSDETTPFPLVTHIRSILIACVIGSFFLTNILEWPFVAAALGAGRRTLGRVVAGCLAAQASSYALLIPAYLTVSGISLATAVRVRPCGEFVPSELHAQVYFIDRVSGDVKRIPIQGGQVETVRQDDITSINSRLFARRIDGGPGWRLFVNEGRRGPTRALRDESSGRPGIGGPARFAAPAEFASGAVENDYWGSFGTATDLRPQSQRVRLVHAGLSSIEGLAVYGAAGVEELCVAWETPFSQMAARCPTVLPGDLVVYELNDQIVVLDPNRKVLGLLTLGHGPLVVLADSPAVP
ncbi:hypothetical protein RAS1_35990 [Phycisphaerae bacterium RAS1]|nr:hypothetical protein RAS1_35990 [Phycisphaerae bacterium RAS1]